MRGDRRVTRWLSVAYLLEGRLLESRNRLKDARQAWGRALETIEPLAQDSKETWLLETWGRALLRLDRLQEAEPVVRELHARGFRQESFRALCIEKGMKT